MIKSCFTCYCSDICHIVSFSYYNEKVETVGDRPGFTLLKSALSSRLQVVLALPSSTIRTWYSIPTYTLALALFDRLWKPWRLLMDSEGGDDDG